MAKLKLVANPTFKARVGIPVPGEKDPTYVVFTFKHRNKTDLQDWLELRGRSDLDMFMEMVTGWDIEGEEFNRENAAMLIEAYGGAAVATVNVYIEQLSRTRVGN